MEKYKIETMQGYSGCIFLSTKAQEEFVGKEKRLLCLIDTLELHCAIMNSKTLGYFIMISKTNLNKLNKKVGDEVSVIFKKDSTELQFEMNEILQEVLETDELAKTKFDSLTNGNKRGLIALVNQPKSLDKQIDRALLIANKLKQNITKPMLILKKEN